MRVLIVNRHFGNDHVPTGRMLRDLTEALAAAGHEVVVLAARSSYVATVRNDLAAGGAEVRYVPTFGEKYRVLSWALFLVQAWIRVPFMRWDRCIALTDPPFLGGVALLLRPFGGRCKRLFWWTMDLYPEILASSGRIGETGLAHRFFRAINNAIIRRMGGFIFLGECQLERFETYPAWRPENYIIVPPWDRRPIDRVAHEDNRFIEKYNLRDKKIALYAGNLGEGHTFAPLVRAAEALRDAGRDDWALVFVIRGSKKAQLEAAAKDLPAILITDYQPVEWTSDLLWSAHVHLITINAASKGLVVPSKLYGVLQTDAPVLFIGPGDADTAREIRRYHAGEDLEEGGEGAEMVAALDRLYARFLDGDPDRLPPDMTGPEQIAKFVTGG
ncbi:MAG: glycosyltransferase family 4 protein [Candidatus Hydrogenedentes bacterium]|nr:glycosyltransferase family 4 protein [Candidatus Hydrogenedentota bacterium]